MFSSKEIPKLRKTTNDWRLTIFGEKIKTPPELLPMNDKQSPHYERWKKENKR